MTERRDVVPDAMSHFPLVAGFSPAVRVGATIYVAGQVGRDSERNPIPDPEQQITRAFENVALVLGEAGATMNDVVEVVAFLTDIQYLPIMQQVRPRFFSSNRAAWTTVGTPRLYDPAIIFEIKVVAVVGVAASD